MCYQRTSAADAAAVAVAAVSACSSALGSEGQQGLSCAGDTVADLITCTRPPAGGGPCSGIFSVSGGTVGAPVADSGSVSGLFPHRIAGAVAVEWQSGRRQLDSYAQVRSVAQS